jgi:hypothetical protein
MAPQTRATTRAGKEAATTDQNSINWKKKKIVPPNGNETTSELPSLR